MRAPRTFLRQYPMGCAYACRVQSYSFDCLDWLIDWWFILPKFNFNVQCVQEKLCFFQEFSLICHLTLCKHWSAVGCTEIGQIGQPIGVTIHSHCVESYENLLQRYVGEGGVAVDNKKTQFFLNTLYNKASSYN